MDKAQRVVVLIRHGETEWTKTAWHTGRADVPLTEAGRADAERLRSRLASLSFARVLVSPLRRAQETCLMAGLGPRGEARPDLMEWDYGDYQGGTYQEVLALQPGWSLWKDRCPAGEDTAQVGARVDRILAEVASIDGNVALFAHGHLLRVLAARWIGLAADGGARFALSPTSVSVLGWERGFNVVCSWNDLAHLQR